MRVLVVEEDTQVAPVTGRALPIPVLRGLWSPVLLIPLTQRSLSMDSHSTFRKPSTFSVSSPATSEIKEDNSHDP